MNDRTGPGEGPAGEDSAPVAADGGLFDALADPALDYEVSDGEARVNRANAAYRSSFGVDDPEGALADRLVADLSLDRASTVRAAAVAGEHHREVVGAEGTDGQRDYLLRTVPGGDGGYVVLTDVTEQRQRTRELAAERDRLDEFASIVSHDLRNPLDVAKVRLEAAADTGEDVHFRKAEQAHERMEAIIDDVLTLARQGQVIDERETVSLSSVAETAWETVSAPAATLRVVDDRAVYADIDRLRELLENLFRNAVAHGGDDVTVTVRGTEGGFAVADDGPGLPQDDPAEVFEAGVSTGEGGTGLGLVIVERIAEAHGWTVDAGTAEDGGALFDVRGVVEAP